MRHVCSALAIFAGASLASAADAATMLRFTLTNLSPDRGNIVSQSSLLLHRGDYDLFDVGTFASKPLERQGEDALRTVAEGSPQPGLLDAFTPYADANPGARGILFNGPTEIPTLGATFRDWLPGQSNFTDVLLDETNVNNAYFSLAFMFLPSNDAFWANDDAAVYRLFNDDGSFNPIDFTILGNEIYDLGTEANDEFRDTTAALDQQFADVGNPTSDVIRLHPGYNPPNGIVEDGGVLDDPRYVNARFLTPGYRVARIQVERIDVAAVPEPATWAMMIGGFAAVGGAMRRRSAKRSAAA